MAVIRKPGVKFLQVIGISACSHEVWPTAPRALARKQRASALPSASFLVGSVGLDPCSNPYMIPVTATSAAPSFSSGS